MNEEGQRVPGWVHVAVMVCTGLVAFALCVAAWPSGRGGGWIEVGPLVPIVICVVYGFFGMLSTTAFAVAQRRPKLLAVLYVACLAVSAGLLKQTVGN